MGQVLLAIHCGIAATMTIEHSKHTVRLSGVVEHGFRDQCVNVVNEEELVLHCRPKTLRIVLAKREHKLLLPLLEQRLVEPIVHRVIIGRTEVTRSCSVITVLITIPELVLDGSLDWRHIVHTGSESRATRPMLTQVHVHISRIVHHVGRWGHGCNSCCCCRCRCCC